MRVKLQFFKQRLIIKIAIGGEEFFQYAIPIIKKNLKLLSFFFLVSKNNI